jgi:hypothetical protein
LVVWSQQSKSYFFSVTGQKFSPPRSPDTDHDLLECNRLLPLYVLTILQAYVEQRVAAEMFLVSSASTSLGLPNDQMIAYTTTRHFKWHAALFDAVTRDSIIDA